MLGAARRVRPCLWKQKQDNSIRLWTWSGVVFTPLAGCSVRKQSYCICFGGFFMMYCARKII